MQIKPSTQQAIKDAMEDLIDAIEAFKMSPNASTLDDVYRATCAIDTVCRDELTLELVGITGRPGRPAPAGAGDEMGSFAEAKLYKPF